MSLLLLFGPAAGGPPVVPLAPSAATSTATLALSAQTRVPLGASAAVSTATLSLTAPTRVTLGAATATSSASLVLTAPARLTLSTGGSSSATLALSAQTFIPLSASAGVSTASATVTTPTTDQFGRPTADIAAAGWVVTPLWSKLDEVTASDADFVTGVAV